MAEQYLTNVYQKQDLTILITNDHKWRRQVDASFNKLYEDIDFISISFDYKHQNIMPPMNSSLARPHMEFAIQFWFLDLRYNISKMERIQHEQKKDPSTENQDTGKKTI